MSASAPAPASMSAPELPPAERLARSRARLREAWLDGAGEGSRKSQDSQNEASSPMWQGLAHFVVQWWAKHPLRSVVEVASEVARPAAHALLAEPAARHPWRLVAAAAAAGAAAVWLRPWRWLPQAALSSVLLSAVWPRGSFTRWLDSGGLLTLLGSGELTRWLEKFMAASGERPATDAGPSPDATTAAPAPQADAAARSQPPAQPPAQAA